MKDVQHYLTDQIQIIEKELSRIVPDRKGPFGNLFEAARYALLGAGKRIRPILTLTTARTLGSNIQAALIPACAIELIHTYSMIHDDLPCMDDDDYRRGRLTVHKKYTEGHAVLTGDFLLTHAFEILAEAPDISPEKKIQLISALARQSGSDGMIGGQVMDVASEGKKISLDELRLLHRNKTASLLSVAVEFGGIISNLDKKHLDILRQFGESIGLAFQVVDDILDVTSSHIKHGNAVGSDIRKEKSTYVSLLGMEQAKAYATQFYNSAMSALKMLPYDTALLQNLADFILKRNH